MSFDSRPNLRALEVFQTVARLLSISQAAVELGISQSAVSHQIRRLTEQIGERLLVRAGRGIRLTETGEALAARLQFAFSEIDRSLAEVIGGGHQAVRIAVCSSFAPGWLIPRLSGFYAVNDGIDLQLKMYARDPALTDDVADAFVTTLPTEAGYWSLFLMKETLVPIAAPQRADGGAEGRAAGQLITTDLEPSRQGRDWKTFRERFGWPDAPGRGPWLFASHYIMALDMAKAGLGTALVPDFLAEPAIGTGLLQRVHPEGLPTGDDYYLCIKEARRSEPALAALAGWFEGQVAAEP